MPRLCGALVRLAVLLLLACANPFNQEGHTGPAGDYLQGITFTDYWHNGYLLPAADVSLTRLAGTGADWVGVLKTAYQDSVFSNEVYEDALRTPSDSAVISVITRARQQGLRVFLVPHVDVKDGTWRGHIDPKDRDAWFSSYTAFMLKSAALARDHDVGLLTIGCEFTRMTDDPRWVRLIDMVRQVYDGPLTYCANWDGFSDVAFWDHLDYIGIDWYVPLCTRAGSGTELQATNLETFLNELGLWADGRSVLFTEAGYPSLPTAGIKPWDWSVDAAPDGEGQADRYRLLLGALEQRPWFAGIFWWEWYAVTDSVVYPTGYTPSGKPAEDVLKDFWL